MMPEQEIDILCFLLRISPDHRVIAHLDIGCGLVTVFVNGCQYLSIFSWVFIKCVPLFTRQIEVGGKSCEDRMIFLFYVNFPIRARCDIIFKTDAAKKIREPWPHRIAIKFAK